MYKAVTCLQWSFFLTLSLEWQLITGEMQFNINRNKLQFWMICNMNFLKLFLLSTLPAEEGASLVQYGRCWRNMFGCQNGASICSPETEMIWFIATCYRQLN